MSHPRVLGLRWYPLSHEEHRVEPSTVQVLSAAAVPSAQRHKIGRQDLPFANGSAVRLKVKPVSHESQYVSRRVLRLREYWCNGHPSPTVAVPFPHLQVVSSQYILLSVETTVDLSNLMKSWSHDWQREGRTPFFGVHFSSGVPTVFPTAVPLEQLHSLGTQTKW